jgi:hypothetical protein
MTRKEIISVSKRVCLSHVDVIALLNGSELLPVSTTATRPYWVLDHVSHNGTAVTRINEEGDEYPEEVGGVWATFHDKSDCAEIDYPLCKSPFEIGSIIAVAESFARAGGIVFHRAMLSSDKLNFVENRAEWLLAGQMKKSDCRLFYRVKEIEMVKRLGGRLFASKSEKGKWTWLYAVEPVVFEKEIS